MRLLVGCTEINENVGTIDEPQKIGRKILIDDVDIISYEHNKSKERIFVIKNIAVPSKTKDSYFCKLSYKGKVIKSTSKEIYELCKNSTDGKIKLKLRIKGSQGKIRKVKIIN